MTVYSKTETNDTRKINRHITTCRSKSLESCAAKTEASISIQQNWLHFAKPVPSAIKKIKPWNPIKKWWSFTVPNSNSLTSNMPTIASPCPSKEYKMRFWRMAGLKIEKVGFHLSVEQSGGNE